MLTTKLVVRVLDAESVLLGWAEVWAEARGDGRLWSPSAVSVGIEQAGTPSSVSVHWADVHVEVRSAFTHAAVHPGFILTLPWANQPVLTVGPTPGYLPPVTVRGARIAMPVGSLGARVS